jgi:hypothetical protein
MKRDPSQPRSRRQAVDVLPRVGALVEPLAGYGADVGRR